MVVGPFALGLIFSPPLTLIAKNRELESPFLHFPPNGKINMSKGSYQLRVCGSNVKRVSDTVRVGVEALSLPKTPFSFQSKTNYRITLESTLVLALAQEE